MKKEPSRHDFAVQDDARANGPKFSTLARLGLAGVLGASLLLVVPDSPNAQQQRYKEPAVRVTSVNTSGNVVSISADGSMGRAQTWQDAEGFHVVLVNGQADAGASAPGVKVRRVGNSLELVVGVKPGANVTVQPRGSRLDLVVSGGAGGALRVENIGPEPKAEAAPRARASEPREQVSQAEGHAASQSAARRRAASEAPSTASAQPAAQPPAQAGAQPQQGAPQQGTPQQQSDLVKLSPDAPPADAGTKAADNPASANAAQAQLTAGEGFDLLSFMTSLPAMLVLLALALGGAAFFVVRRRRSAGEGAEVEVAEVEKKKSRWKVGARAAEDAAKPFEQFKGDRRKASLAVPFERRTSGRGADDEATREQRLNPEGDHSERGIEARGAGQFAPAVQFGAYRIDQEIARLVEGQPHSVEVIASRAADDRRAVETSLLKVLRAPETPEDGRRRARMALEDYGYVARSCAQLLLGGESFERASAARTLGEMKSAQALPFLTEALYDSDAVVRMECVQGLGALGLPSAIGALLDAARRHPELPATILSPVLTACSVESLDLTWDSPEESRTFAEAGGEEFFDGEVHVLAAAAEYEELPEWVEDEALQAALERLSSPQAESRATAAQQLAQFQVRRAVEALSALALHDGEPAVRSAAVTSLGLINHESVFVPVVVSLADEAREVRAAAARALSRLSFDRADAYVRVIESADEQTRRQVAHSCVKAGLAAQAISRIASEDRRQAYEAFSLLTLAAKGGEMQPILDTVECHRDIEVRLACIRLLGLSYQPELGEHLLRIASNGGVPERVRRAILDTVEGAAQPQPVLAQ